MSQRLQDGARGDEAVAGVIAPPPLIYAAALIGGAILHFAWPATIGPTTLTRPAAAVLMLVAVCVAVTAIRAMLKARTHFDPCKPTKRLLTQGVYSVSRNPMYLALNGLAIGIALAVNSVWMLATLLPALVVLRTGVIAREERYLDGLFGEEYRRYSSRVRRWL